MYKYKKIMEWYIWREKSMVQITGKFENKSYRKTMNQ